MDVKARIRSALITVDDDVVEELAQHASAIYASARAEGGDAAEAGRRVDDQIQAWATDPAVLRRRPKRPAIVEPPSMGSAGLATVLQDVRYAWRLIRRQPAYAALLVATMALGISATTVLGSVAYGVLLKPLPWANAPRLARVYESRQGSTRRLRAIMTNASYVAWRTAPQTLDAIGAWATSQMTITGEDRAERIRVAEVTPSLLPMLEARALVGRIFVDGDDAPARSSIALISHALWQQRFGSRPDISGTTLRLNGKAYTIRSEER